MTVEVSMAGYRRFVMPFFVLLALGLVAEAAPSQFPTLNLSYRDTQDTGTATIIPLSSDPASGGTRINVQITQHGATYQGQGFVRELSAVQHVSSFWVTDRGGASTPSPGG
jgi:hypothetical protein